MGVFFAIGDDFGFEDALNQVDVVLDTIFGARLAKAILRRVAELTCSHATPLVRLIFQRVTSGAICKCS